MRQIIASFLLCILLAPQTRAGDKVGNGGDLVRAAFFATGESIVRELKEIPAARALVQKHKINLAMLKGLLSIDKVRVVKGPLVDSSGSVVDAIGSPEGIVLDRDRWTHYILKRVDLRKLIFHELLRAQGIDDDDYVISKELPPPNPNLGMLNGGYSVAHEAFSQAHDLAAAAFISSLDRSVIVYSCQHFTPNATLGSGGYTISQFLNTGIKLLEVETGWEIILGPTSWGLATTLPTTRPDGFRLAVIRSVATGVVVEFITKDVPAYPGRHSAVLPFFHAEGYMVCQ